MVVNTTLAASPASTPLNTTLFVVNLAAVVPSYTLLLAVMPEVIVTPLPVIFAVRIVGWLKHVIPRRTPGQLNPLTVTGTLLLTLALAKFATYPLVVSTHIGRIRPPAPRSTPRCSSSTVAAVVPSYTLLLAVMPEVIVTPLPVIFAVRFVGWLNV